MMVIPLISVLLGLLVSYTHSDRPVCSDGIQQSPINIEVNATEYSRDLDFETKLPKSKYSIDERNSSLTFTLHLGDSVEYPQIDWIRRSGNSVHYDLNHLDFRWSSNDSSGSEHSIDNKFGAAELRLHYYKFGDTDYEAALMNDGVLIQVYILELGKKLDLAEIFNFNKTDNSGNIELDLSQIFSITSNSKFLKYEGSLNSCAITWLVMMDTVEITTEQLDKLRSLNSEGNVNEQHSTDTELNIVRNFKIQVILK